MTSSTSQQVARTTRDIASKCVPILLHSSQPHTRPLYLGFRHNIPAQGIYNRLLLVPIVGSACFQRHQLAAVFNASFSVFQVTYEISHITRMGEEGVFCDAMPTYP